MGRVGLGCFVTTELFMDFFSSDPEVIAAVLVPSRSLNGTGDTT